MATGTYQREAMMINKILKVSSLLLPFIFLVFFYGTSLSCNYHLKVRTPTQTWDGMCQLGQSSWIETDGDSKWHVEAWSFAIGSQLFFIDAQRTQIFKKSKIPTPFDDFNSQTGSNAILSYGLYHLPDSKLALFQSFPTESVIIGKLTGDLSLFSSSPKVPPE